MPKGRSKRTEDSPLRIASIDVGSNTVLLLIADIYKSGTCKALYQQSFMPRLGNYVAKNKSLGKSGYRRLYRVLNAYKKKCLEYKVDKIICLATEAMRRAADRDKISKSIFEELKLKVKTISPRQEATLSYLSATAELRTKPKRTLAVIDIGGGSTEITNRTSNDRLKTKSIPLGALLIRNKFAIKYPVSKSKLNEIDRYIKKRVETGLSVGSRIDLVGVGGSITSIPRILKAQSKHDHKAVDFFNVKTRNLNGLIGIISSLKIAQIKRIKGIPKGREDILLPGLMILRRILDLTKTSSITVRNRGLRYGAIFNYIKEIYPHAQIRFQ